MLADVSSPVISATGLVKRYGSNAVLTGTSFEIGPGVTGLLGSNGAGKTTLLGLVLGLARPDDGNLVVLGSDPRTAGPEVRARIGYSPEHHLLPPDLPAIDFVRHIAEIHGLGRDDADRAGVRLAVVHGPRRGEAAAARDPVHGSASAGEAGHGHRRTTPSWCCSTNQPTAWTPPSATRCSTSSDACRRSFGLSVVLSSHLLDEVERTCSNVVISPTARSPPAGRIDTLRGEDRGLIVEVDWGSERWHRPCRDAGSMWRSTATP